ncbi:MAG: L,D-transpeptidase family protein [Candidatus Omnitrophota bacterium]|nr:L,D-transpeptidase family protein [Candidatus Omnitrophota bacterium]
MKKNTVYIIAVIAAVIAITFLLISQKKNVVTKSKPPARSIEPASRLYKEAEKLAGEDKLLKAKEVYKRLLAEYPESNLVRKSRIELDKLNIKILFSPIATENSVFYEVKTGDTLSRIAKNFGTTVELIMKSNNLKSSLIKPGMKLKISKAKYGILVDKSQNTLILKSGSEVLKTYTVSTGADDSTPAGTYEIANKLINPVWYNAGAVVPSGSPENILGSRWMGFTAIPGYGIHGTRDESTIGRHVTAGCVRMKNMDVEELYSIIPAGAEVVIID